ncbi:MAG: ribonuclease D [Planctomycetota bacterium]
MPTLVDTPEALPDALDALASNDRIACDTESDSFFAYRPRVCLIQFSVPGIDLLIDPLADLDLAPLGDLLADPERTVIFHAAENDIIQLQHEFGWRVGNLFDTQIASFILGEPPYSLAGVLESRFDVRLDKSQQRSDWSRRPLEAKQIEYAAEDTAHLLALHEVLVRHAEEAGRMEEIQSECRRIAAREWEPEPFDPEGFWRFKAAKGLDPWGLRILRGLYLMRHEEADRRNRAPYRIANDSVLVTIARDKVTAAGRGIPERFWGRYGRRIAGIVRATKDQPPLAKPKRAPSRGATDTPDTKERYERLRAWRKRAAEERGVESWVIARNELMMRLARAAPATRGELAPLLEPFRDREYGESILAALLA